MRSSFCLTLISLLSSLVYGFSSQPLRLTFQIHQGGIRPGSVPRDQMSMLLSPRGGASRKTEVAQTTTPYDTGTKCPATGAMVIISSLWGTGGVLYILSKAIKRVLPIAMEPFQKGAVPLSQFELGYVDVHRIVLLHLWLRLF